MAYSTFVRDITDRQKLYRTSEPFACTKIIREPGQGWLQGRLEPTETSFIVSSWCNIETEIAQGCPETYLFAANEDGEVIDWCEMEGSFKGAYNHEEAMNNSNFPLKE